MCTRTNCCTFRASPRRVAPQRDNESRPNKGGALYNAKNNHCCTPSTDNKPKSNRKAKLTAKPVHRKEVDIDRLIFAFVLLVHELADEQQQAKKNPKKML